MPHEVPQIEGVELRPIPGFIGYAAGSDGNIYSFWRRGGLPGRKRGHSGRFVSRTPQGLAGCITSRGRVLVGGRRVGENYKRFLSYRLIASAFHGPCPEGMECSHINGNTLDNRPRNLAWETHAANERRKVEHDSLYCGENHHRARLREVDVESIRALGRRFPVGSRPAGFVRNLASSYGVGKTTIYKILGGHIWKSVRG